MHYILYTFLMALILGGCSSIQVSSDYDPNFKAQTLHSYAIINKPKKGEDSLTMDRIATAISHRLNTKGYHQEAQADADFLILFHVGVESKTRIDTDYQFVGMYPYGMGGGMVATTRVDNYDEGKLIVDIINPKNNKIIWRSITTDRLQTLDTPQERVIYIHDVITQALETFPSQKSIH